MNWLTLIGWLFRAVGLAEWFDGWLKRRDAAKKAQSVADAPITRHELEKDLKDGML